MQSGPAAGTNEVFLVTSAEGKLQLMSGKNGRLEKSVDAHRGACLSARYLYLINLCVVRIKRKDPVRSELRCNSSEYVDC